MTENQFETLNQGIEEIKKHLENTTTVKEVTVEVIKEVEVVKEVVVEVDKNKETLKITGKF